MGDEQTLEKVREVLRDLSAEEDGPDLVSAGLIPDIKLESGRLQLGLRLPPGTPRELTEAVRAAALGVDGVASVTVNLLPTDPTGSDGVGVAPPSPRPRERQRAPETGSRRPLPVVGAPDATGEPSSGQPARPQGMRPTADDRRAASRHPREAEPMEGVRHVIAVSSGKGGVGKSTVSTNLAAAWASQGQRVGLLDADIYGPDIPTMFGVQSKPRLAGDRVIPLDAHGVKLMSLGFLVDEDTPAIWRGPIIMGIVRQFLQQVEWGELDYLIVDLPPGTGDAQLSLCQLVKVSGAVMVTTPQDVAVGGVLKGIRMFETLDVPVLGVVENMRGFVCPGCGDAHDIFGSGGGEKLAASLGLPFLGAVPLGMAVREEADRGVPTVVGRPDSPEALAFTAVARAASDQLLERKVGGDPSRIGASEPEPEHA